MLLLRLGERLGPICHWGADMRLDTGATPIMPLDWAGETEVAPPTFLRFPNLAGVEPSAVAGIWQHLVDGLSEQIALVDENWTILVVNRSWAIIGELYGHSSLVAGANYLEFCRKMAADGLEIARDVVHGIEQIIAGERESFQLVYRARAPELGRDHQLCVNRFEVGGHKFTSITRYDVTRLIELRRLREDFSNSVIVSQAEERRRMGREIHDSTMQLMVCLDMKIGQLKRTCDIGGSGEILEEMRQLLAETQHEIRSISYLAHPPQFDTMDLAEALRALAEGFGRRTNLDIRFEIVGQPRMPSTVAEGAVYRIVQEALSNVHRHARAKHAVVRLSQRRGLTHVIVADDGVGMPDVVELGVGMSGMRSRLAELGGRLCIRSSPLRGTAVIASVPAQRLAAA